MQSSDTSKGRTKSAMTSTAFSNERARKSWLPTWAWMPTSPGASQFVERLVVAVQLEVPGRHSCSQGHVQLATGGHVEVHALVVHEAGHGPAEEGLAGVRHPRPEGGHRLPAPGPEVGLVVD